jgi:hypothetical protein
MTPGSTTAKRFARSISRRHRRAVPLGDAHGRRDLVRRGGQNDGVRDRAIDRRVVLVDQQILGEVQHAIVAECLQEFPDER